MSKAWEFFEDMHDFVAVTDLDTRELVYMNKKFREMCGMLEHTEYQGKRCYEVIQHGYTPCAMCKNHELEAGKFKERNYYNPIWNKNFVVKDAVIEEDGRRYHVEISIELGSEKEREEEIHNSEELESLANDALRIALRRDTPEETIMVFLKYLGELLGGERIYVFEKNEKGNDDNTYEWVAPGVPSLQEKLQDLPGEVCAGWYQHFSENQQLVIRELEDIKKSDPLQYENLKSQGIRSLVVVPLYREGKAIGFYGVGNPSGNRHLDHISTIMQMMAYYIVAAIRRRDLILRLQQEEQERASETYQKQVNETVARNTQEYLDMVNEIIGSGLWYINFDEDGKMTGVVWSRKFREMLGFTETAEFPDVLEAWSDRLYPKDQEKTLKAFWECVEGKGEYDVKQRIMKKNGKYEWFHMHGHCARYANGAPRLFLGTFINITKELQAQQALEEAYQAANRANAAKTEFMANMSHDIRTPLNAIVGMTAIASSNLEDTEKVGHCLDEITDSTEHLMGMVNEVLDMNRIEAGQVKLNIEPFHMQELIDDFVKMARPLAEGKNHTFLVDIQEMKHEKILGDRERIHSCLMNFMENAVKYTPDGGQITFSVAEKETNRPKRGCYVFVFEDNGIGMSKEFVEHIFEPFARADDKRVVQQQGTGLGMPITKNIIQMMNGDIKVKSEPEKGSTFTATIFLELQDEREDYKKEDFAVRPNLNAYKESDFQHKRILLVEDNEMNAEIAIEILSMTGLKIDHAWNGKEATEMLEKSPEGYYQLIFMDIQMPVMNGYEATKVIRASEREDIRTIPIVAVSANAFAEDVQAAKEAGMNEHIAKPLDLKRLLVALQIWL